MGDHPLSKLLVATESFSGRLFARVNEALNAANILDINPTQAVLIRRMGSDEMTVGNLTLLGCYIGTNSSYNLNSLLKRGYLAARKSPDDQRSTLVKVTKKGLAIGRLVEGAEDRCLNHLAKYSVPVGALEDALGVLERANRVLG